MNSQDKADLEKMFIML